jgi:hypothetical protein
MHEAISFTLPSITDERAHQGFGRKFATHFVRDMDEGLTAKDAEVGNVGLVPAPGFFGCAVAEGTGWRDIVK